MSLQLSVTEFGGPLSSPVTNPNPATRADAEWAVDLDQLGPTLAVDLSLVASGDLFNVDYPIISLWASSLEGDTSGAGTLLASILLPIGGTGGFVGFKASASIPNPGGRKFLVLTSINGTAGAPLAYRGVRWKLRTAS